MKKQIMQNQAIESRQPLPCNGAMKMDLKDELKEAAEKLREQRDELKLKMHLANMEMRDEWENLEEKWDNFSARSQQFQKEMEPTVNDIHTALSLLADELKAGYKKIKESL